MASFALWFCDCAILLSIALRDNDIKIQRRHIKLGKVELKTEEATCHKRSVSGWYRSHRAVHTEFHPNEATPKMKWQKLMEVVIGLTDGFVHARAVVVLTFASVK